MTQEEERRILIENIELAKQLYDTQRAFDAIRTVSEVGVELNARLSKECCHLADVAKRLALRAENAEEESDILAEYRDAAGAVYDELDRSNDLLADVAYRLARRCEVLEELVADLGDSAYLGTSLGEYETPGYHRWLAARRADAEAEVAKNWPE